VTTTIIPTYTDNATFLAVVAAAYRAVVAEADEYEGTTKSEAQQEAVARLRQMVDSGELSIPVDFALYRAVDRADESDGKSADKVIKRIVLGQPALDLDADAYLDTVVVLGDGLRKPLRNVREADLRLMDNNRYRSVRDQMNAYDDWRVVYEAALDAVVRFGTLAAAVDAGAFIADAIDQRRHH